MNRFTLITILFLTNTIFSQTKEALPFVSHSDNKNQVHINTNTDIPTEIKVYNSRGNLISSFTVKQTDTLNLNNLRTGAYFVVGIIEGQKLTGTFRKN